MHSCRMPVQPRRSLPGYTTAAATGAHGYMYRPTLLHGHALKPRVVTTAAAASTPLYGSSDQQATAPSQKKDQSWLQSKLQWWFPDSPTPDATEADGQVVRTPLKPLISKVLALVAPDKGMLVLASIFMVLAALAELAVPHYATSCIFSAAAPGATRASFEGTLKLLSGIIIFYGFMSALRGYCFSILNNRMTKRLRTQLFANLVRRDTGFFDGNETGSLTSRLQADCQAMTRCVATNLNIAFRNTLQAIGGSVYLAMTSPVMCGATIAVCVALWALTLLYGEYARRTQKVIQDTLACSNQVAEEVLSMTRIVRTFGTEGFEENRYTGWLGRLYDVGLRQASGYGLFVVSGHITCYMTKVVALALGCGMLIQGNLTAEQLTNFLFYVEFVTYASLNACDEVVEVMEAVGASERVMSLLEAPPAPQVMAGVRPERFTGRVEMRGVNFRYPTRTAHAALTDINLVLEPGQLVALVGLSGSGKTTLVSLLQRLYDPSSGSIMFDDHDLRDVDSEWFRSQIGVVSQDPRLFGTTISANIAYGYPQATPAGIQEAAKQANAHEFIMSLPQGYETRVTDRLLSGGQRQRIALARALVRKPRLLILDEATSALDAESEAQVQAALDAAMQSRERTVVVIAHRLSTVRNADVTIVMEQGKIVERGNHAKLLEQRGIYHQLVSKQQYQQEQPAHLPSVAPAVQAPSSRPSNGARRPDQNGNGNGNEPINGNGYGNGASNGNGTKNNGNGNGSVMITGVDANQLQGVSSGDEASTVSYTATRHSGSSRSLTLEPLLPVAAVDALAVAAAAGVVAETELSSKLLGSQDPIDHESGP